MDSAIRKFDKRQRALRAKHQKLAHGYRTKLNRNGTIEHKPIRRVPFITARGLLLAVVGFLVFKGFVLASLGDAEYADRIGLLSHGTVAEKAGAWMMGLDPATLWVASHLQPYLS